MTSPSSSHSASRSKISSPRSTYSRGPRRRTSAPSSRSEVFLTGLRHPGPVRGRLIAGAVAAALLVGSSGGATAASRAASASTYTGYAFDACTAPSQAALGAWLSSPYRALGIYIGGVNRACYDGNLSPSWVASPLATGWSLLPLSVGLQAPCVPQSAL